MPEFSDLFVEEVKRNRDRISRVIESRGAMPAELRDAVRKKWMGFPDGVEAEGLVFAVDSSSGSVELSGGGVLLVARALALPVRGQPLRKLRVEAFYPRSLRDYEDYTRLLREHLEHEVAMEALEEEPAFVLVDGSLHARMAHVIRELELEGREDFIFDYVETYGEFLNRALKRGAIVVGVSKDSRSTVFKEGVLREQAVLAAREGGADVADVLRLWRGLYRRPKETLKLLSEGVKTGALPAKLLPIFEEAASHTPDSKVILCCGLGEGFSTPLLVTLSRVSAGQIELVLSESAEEHAARLSRVFPRTSDKLGSEFEERVRRLISRLRSYPPVAAFYTILGRGDDPLRVDVVGGDLGRAGLRSHEGEPDTVFLDAVPESVARAIGLLRALYAGSRGYNMLLLEADRRVKITRDVIELYTRIVSDELGVVLVHSRGERRVSFP